jgi:DNA-binding Lrp family transcriptional regulator
MNKLFTTAGIEEEIRLRLLKMVDEADGALTQREMARRMGISQGKTNYCLLELVKKGAGQGGKVQKQPIQGGLRLLAHSGGLRGEGALDRRFSGAQAARVRDFGKGDRRAATRSPGAGNHPFFFIPKRLPVNITVLIPVCYRAFARVTHPAEPFPECPQCQP